MSTSGNMRIGFAGGGKMAEAIMRGLIKSGHKSIEVYDPSADRLKYLNRKYRVRKMKSNREALTSSDILFIAVKPGDVAAVCREIKDAVSREKVIISIAAGITLSYLRFQLNTNRIVRVMPNTPALIGKGMTVIASSSFTKKKDIAIANKIFSLIGEVLIMDEKYMDAVTAVSGSGPAFVSLFVEALVDGAVRMGIQRDHALKLAQKTAQGTLGLLNNGITLSGVREMVTSPGGTTAEGLYVMECEGFKGIMIDAVKAACNRAAEITDQFSEVNA